jgi:hypothetical protein
MGYEVHWSVFLILYIFLVFFMLLFAVSGLILNLIRKTGNWGTELKKTANLVMIGIAISTICKLQHDLIQDSPSQLMELSLLQLVILTPGGTTFQFQGKLKCKQ